MIFLLNRTKRYFLPFLFLIFTTLIFEPRIQAGSLDEGFEKGTAALKYTCAFFADYYDFEDENKKAMTFSFLYLIMDVIDGFLKYKVGDNANSTEIGLSIINAIRLFDNIQKYSQIKPAKRLNAKKKNKEQNKKITKESLEEQKLTTRSFNTLLDKLLKYTTYFGDHYLSIWSVLEKEMDPDVLSDIFSWYDSFQKKLSLCGNNKKGSFC